MKLLFVITFFSLISQHAFACKTAGYPDTRWVGITESSQAFIVKTNQTCVHVWDLKKIGGRLNYRSIEVINIESDGSVITKLETIGENNYNISFKPTVPGEHWVKYRIRQYPIAGPSFDVIYVLNLKVDIPYKDPGSLD